MSLGNKKKLGILSIFLLYLHVSIGQAITQPCSVSPVGNYDISCYEFYDYVLVFDDEFIGNALDKSKWMLPSQNGDHNPPLGLSLGGEEYNDDQHYIFNHPGVTLWAENVPSFTAQGFDWDPTSSRTWCYKASNLKSLYQFPSVNSQPNGLGGIFVTTCVLPEHGAHTSAPYGSYGAPGMIWPAIWMWNIINGDYGEIDDFEFPHSSTEDIQSVHAPVLEPHCSSTVDPGNIDFGDGSMHTHTLIYTQDEIDWWIDNYNTSTATRFYYEVPINVYLPVTCNNASSGDLVKNNHFPDIPMWLILNCSIYNTNGCNPLPPINFKIQSVKYYENLLVLPDEVVNAPMINNNAGSDVFNVFAGGTVELHGPILIPQYKQAPYLGQLEAIGRNSVVITGPFKNSGYFVAKTDGNISNEYSGPLPYDATSPGVMTKTYNNSSNRASLSIDTLNVKTIQSLTRGSFSVILTNVSTNEIGQTAQMIIYNMLGQIIYTKNIVIQSEYQIPLDLSTQPRGVYLVAVKTNNKMFYSKVILQ